MSELNPYEYVIVEFMKQHKGRRFSHSEISEHCNMNIRTAKRYCLVLSRKRIIKSENDRNKSILYYIN